MELEQTFRRQMGRRLERTHRRKSERRYYKIKGGKTVRITVYCDDEEDALALKKYFGGTVREIKTQDWVATQKREKRPPLKIRDALVITEQSSPENLAALRKQFPSRCILSVPAEMAFGTGDHATTSTCLRFICDAAKSRRKTGNWKCRKFMGVV